MLPTVPKVRLEKEPQGRLRWRASALPHLADLVTVALETGLRRSEVEGLTWDRVDLSRGVLRLELAKSGRRREVPMRQRVYDVLIGRPGPREGRLWPEGSTRAGFEAAVDAANVDAPFQKMGHASLAMTMRYAHLSPEHLRGEMAKTERSAGVEPVAGTRAGQSGQNAPEVVEFTDERRGSSVAEQLIRNQ